MNLPTLAVVIPNRNDSATLPACLGSVLNQTIRPDQIIFVDDQSSDNSTAVAKDILKNFNRAQIIVNPECLGTMGALNEGLKRATSDYVLFLASNDFVFDGLFKQAKQSIFETGFPGVWSAMVWASGTDGIPKYLYPSPVVRLNGDFIPPDDCIRLAMKTASWFMGTTLFFHREALMDIGGFDSDYQGLADLLAALTISSTNGATFLAKPLGVMRIHGGGYLHRTITDLKNLERILSIIENKGPTLSPRLFNSIFCDRMKNRFRFAAIRALSDLRKVEWPENWTGARYSILNKIVPLMEKHKIIKTVLAMLLLRPFDIFPMIWYRLLGTIWITASRTKASSIMTQNSEDASRSNEGSDRIG